MRSILQAHAEAAARLTAAGVPSPEHDAWRLLEAASGLSRSTLLLTGASAVPEATAARLAGLVEERAARVPLQHVLGVAHFYGLELAVDARVLVPRPETERLVELVLRELADGLADAGPAPATVLDVGTGSGAIALALKAELTSAEVWGTDVSEDALAVARGNAARLGLAVGFLRSDLLADEEVAALARRAAVLAANLPYLPESDRVALQPEAAADPPGALFAADGGLAIAARLADQAWLTLPRGALLALELDPRNVRGLAERLSGWEGVRLEPDLAGRERFLLARR
ncbi:MAG: peptide chain release factor N(5)-glutamine methyltransferase [Trueperaceae bacterium]|nr:peptide chain release factor N(5)-glutamine methyltransferase [Trueperaceae bacterium]MCO5174885.1 peptide chain release factor N(5)-glutamine methyltransferase [Trueperaceae bacterium]